MGSIHIFVAAGMEFAFCQNDCKYKFGTNREVENFNKKLVLYFSSQGLASTADLDTIREAAYMFISSDLYIQHNPVVPDGREAFLTAIQAAYQPMQGGSIRQIAADGDLIWLHSEYGFADGSKNSVIDIYRVKCGKIVEHWDVVQQIDPNLQSPNAHPYF